MARYIDAYLLISELRAGCMPIDEKGISGVLGDKSCIRNYIDSAPTVMALNRRGRNLTNNNPVDEFICSRCGFITRDFGGYDEEEEVFYEFKIKYCPKCGVRIDIEN